MAEINSLLIEKPHCFGNKNGIYSVKKILMPNIPIAASKSVSSVTVNTPGEYTDTPIVIFSGGGGEGAEASAFLKALSADPVVRGVVGNPTDSYAPNDTITLLVPEGDRPIITVNTTRVMSVGIVDGGSGGEDGAGKIITGTTGTGTKFQASCTITGGEIVSIDTLDVIGSYSANPSNLNAEPVTGASLVGATVSLTMGYDTFTLTDEGHFSGAVPNPILQYDTSGTGVGAAFNLSCGVDTVEVTEGGEDYLSVPSVVFSSDGTVTPATATAVISAETGPATANVEFSKALETSEYEVNLTPSVACSYYVHSKSTAGFSITAELLDSSEFPASTIDAVLSYLS